jgi:Zn-dependent alcohol dehydrogenase
MNYTPTKAAVTDGKGNYSIEQILVGEPAEGEVLVEIQAAGICHTDYDSLNWKKQLVLGHEGAGIVSKVGPKVKHIQPGDHVILNWAIPCKTCTQCQSQNQHICETNSPVTGKNPMDGHAKEVSSLFKEKPIHRSFNLGTLSERTIVKQEAISVIDKSIPFSSACIVGCGVMTGYGSAVNAAKVNPGSTVVVLGAGGVGLNVIQGARIAGATKIIAIDPSENRLQLAKKFGATDFISPDQEDRLLLAAAQQVKALNRGRGADFAFECTSIPRLGAAPLAMIRNAGVAIQASGIEEEITIDMNLFEWDKVYINPLYGKCQPERDIPILLDLYQQGSLKLDELVTNTYGLEDLHQAFADMLSCKNAKGVIQF